MANTNATRSGAAGAASGVAGFRSLLRDVLLAALVAVLVICGGLFFWLGLAEPTRELPAQSGQWLTVLEPARALLQDWFQHVPFSQSTINAVPLQDAHARVPLVVAVMLWLAVAGVLFLVTRALRGAKAGALGGLVALFLVAWVMLDLRWQASLWQTHGHTLDSFQGVPADERSFPEMGGSELLKLVNTAHEQMDPGSRVVIAAEQRGPALYARYRLLPLPGYHRERLGARLLRRMGPGDALLLLGNSNVDLLSFRRELSLAMRARFPVVLHAEQLAGEDMQLHKPSSRAVLEYAGEAQGDIRGEIPNAVPAAFYRLVAVVETPNDAAGVRLEARRVVDAPEDVSHEVIARRVLSVPSGRGFEEHSLAFAVPGRERLELGVTGLPPGSRVAELRLEYPEDPDKWLIVTRDHSPPYRAARPLQRSEVGALLEFQ